MATPDQDLFITIDNYVRGVMTPDEVVAFEKQMSQDMHLQQLVSEHAEIWRALDRMPALDRWEWLANHHPDTLAALVEQDLATDPAISTSFMVPLAAARTLAMLQEPDSAEAEQDRLDRAAELEREDRERRQRGPDLEL